jgi:hypothetical protein
MVLHLRCILSKSVFSILIRTSPLFYPTFGVYIVSLIREHWPVLSTVAAGEADIAFLPPDLFDGIDVEFALMSEAERIALYQKGPEACAQRTQDYMQRTKSPTHPGIDSQHSIESSSLHSKPMR